MRILVLSPEYPPHVVGGLGKHVHEISEQLVQQGVEVYLVTPGYPGSALYEEKNGVHIFRSSLYEVNPLGFIDHVLQMNINLLQLAIEIIKTKGGFSLIHVHDWLVGFAGKALKNAFQLPLVATVHATEHGRNHGIHNELQNYIHKTEWMLTYEAWQVIACSNYMAEEMKRVFALPANKITVIPNGINASKFSVGKKELAVFRQNYASPEEKIVLSVGRLVHEKGMHVLLDAFAHVLCSVPNAKLVIVGKGGERESLESKSRQMGIEQKVYFTGFMSEDDLLCLYKCANIAVFPSLYEPFGIVALEGMAAQVPTIVSDTGGLGEIVVEGEDGLKALPGDCQALSQKIVNLLQNEEWAASLAKNAWLKVNDIYNWTRIAGQTKALYEDVIEQKSNNSWFSFVQHTLEGR